MKTILTITLSFVMYYSFAQWYPQNSGTDETLTSVCFIDTLYGWVAGVNGIILHTKDGGVNWEEQASESNSYLNGICFVDSLNGWTIGRKPGYPSFGQVLHTTNGGKIWEQIIDGELMWKKYGIFFTDELNGWAIDGPAHTSDGGETWEPQNGIYFNHSGDIYFTDSLNGWIAGSAVNGSTGYCRSSIIHTNNGGETWDNQFEIYIREGYRLYSIYFADSLKGWAVGGLPTISEIILKTIDGGNNWDTAYINNSGTLHSVYFADSYNGLAVGWGRILFTSDGGYTWEIDPSGTNHILYDVSFDKYGYSWAVGDGGRILKADYSQIVGKFELNVQENKLNVSCSPNPFSTSTTIEYELNQPETVTITFYNQFGKQVDVIEERQPQGLNRIEWTAKNLADGVYYFRLEAGEQVASGKVVLMR